MMESPAERSANLNPGRVVIAYDATKGRNCHEIRDIVADIMMRDGMIEEVDTITVLGVLHRVMHPSKAYFFVPFGFGLCDRQMFVSMSSSWFSCGFVLLGSIQYSKCSFVKNV